MTITIKETVNLDIHTSTRGGGGGGGGAKVFSLRPRVVKRNISHTHMHNTLSKSAEKYIRPQQFPTVSSRFVRSMNKECCVMSLIVWLNPLSPDERNFVSLSTGTMAPPHATKN